MTIYLHPLWLRPLNDVPPLRVIDNAVHNTAIPILCTLGLLLIAILPLPGNTLVLTGALIAAVCLFNKPRLRERSIVLSHLSPLFSAAIKIQPKIQLLEGISFSSVAPRGIRDDWGKNTWLTSGLQLLHSSASITRWLKRDAPKELLCVGSFFKAYDEGKEISSTSVRSGISKVFPMNTRGVDPFDFLACILDSQPNSQKAHIRKTVHYNAPLNYSRYELEVFDAKTPIISLQIRDANPHLEKMLHSFLNERPVGLKRTEVDIEGKTRIYRANKIERRFSIAPKEMWFHIVRFENNVRQSVFNEVPVVNSLFPSIDIGVEKNRIPVSVPREIEITPLFGKAKTFRLNAFLAHEGSSPQEDRVKAYRYEGDTLYGCCNDWVVKIPRSAVAEILSQAYLLHYEPL